VLMKTPQVNRKRRILNTESRHEFAYSLLQLFWGCASTSIF